jgi:hypothetical protein
MGQNQDLSSNRPSLASLARPSVATPRPIWPVFTRSSVAHASSTSRTPHPLQVVIKSHINRCLVDQNFISKIWNPSSWLNSNLRRTSCELKPSTRFRRRHCHRLPLLSTRAALEGQHGAPKRRGEDATAGSGQDALPAAESPRVCLTKSPYPLWCWNPTEPRPEARVRHHWRACWSPMVPLRREAAPPLAFSLKHMYLFGRIRSSP